ncbi:hypothetical protein [Portibacter lacus]|uniref:Uncharacterized protein n=1 Tax=Portibacter lacus TaxID=1099794 RepID=A0AA37SM12_9BACT|nr:hypothetical protein [Portibacter lacus]GLR17123.1 hypothetical protein GCM10007940_17380 [Portibacter lacus]
MKKGKKFRDSLELDVDAIKTPPKKKKKLHLGPKKQILSKYSIEIYDEEE